MNSLNNFLVLFNTLFESIHKDSVGSICYSYSTAITLSIQYCIFKECSASTNKEGGCIYFSTNDGKLFCNNNCIYKIEAYFGSFLYATMNKQKCDINKTSSNACIANLGNIIYVDFSIAILRDYNSSDCESHVYVNINFRLTQSEDIAFLNFYKNRDDILIHVSCYDIYSSIIQYGNFISNTYYKKDFGFICVNDIDEMILNVSNCNFKENTHVLFSPKHGGINIFDIYCDTTISSNPSGKINQFNVYEKTIKSVSIDNILNNICQTMYILDIIDHEIKSDNTFMFSIPFYSIFLPFSQS